MKNSKNKIKEVDLTNSKRDIEKLKAAEINKERPQTKDTNGSEDELNIMNEESNVSKEEAILLERSADSQAGPEDQAWNEALLDTTDEDGEPLNVETEFSGKDLDIPGAEDDDENEEIGEEDEENNSYSLGSDKND